MNANPVSSLAVLFVVMLSTGQYSDHHSAPVQGFASREAADRFLNSKEGEVRRLEGMKDAIHAMHAEWQKGHAAPDYNSDDHRAYEAWHSLNSAEIERLETITGFREAIEAAGHSRHDDVTYISYYIIEIPFTA